MESTLPKVSILMPVYNGEKYLKEAINSVLAQTFRDFELIIINDGSTDSTQSIIESYSDTRIRVYLQNNQGVAQSLNTGLKLAKGMYIWRHDADDICLMEQLQTQLEFLKRYPNFVLVSTQIAFMTDKGYIAYDYKQPHDTYFQNQPFIKVKREHFNPYSPITHATVLIKKEVFNAIGVYRTEFKTSEDTDLWLRIIEKYDAAVLNYCSYFVRLNSTSATQVHKTTTSFYRDLAYEFADERFKIGTDPLQRFESMPIPNSDLQVLPAKVIIKGKHYRNDLLDFYYKVALNAKDKYNSIKIIKQSIKSGWKLSQTWKGILFPLLNKKIIDFGVNVKRKFK